MSGKRQWEWCWHVGRARGFKESSFIQETERYVLAGAQSMRHETKLRGCWRSAHLRFYGHFGVFTDPLPGTGFVLGTRETYN